MNVTLLIDAIIFGNLLVLLSIGLTLTYITLKIPNFAHGDFATIGIYVAYYFLVFHKISPYITLPIAFLVSGTIALLSYLLVFRPLNNRGISIVGLMVASIAIEVALRSTLHIYADSLTNVYKVISRGFIFRDFGIRISRTIYIPGLLIVSTALTFTLIITLYILLTKTKFGIAMRAAIENPDLAEVLGVDVNKVYAVSWFLAGGLAGLAGALVPFRMPANPEIGWMLLLRVFSSSILGGLSSIYGAMLGGYIVGFAEVIGIQLLSNPPFNLSTAYRPAIPFAILIATLLLMPEGLASKIKLEKITAKIRGVKKQ
ncbi:MAG: branched-chain amino acid ABC transporter permease [Desulfurococcales archaeon ex4484_217_2]|nr:MAG: branched-chain amino acid ABC transporter permease [Desulfurococcales archaeon ex4484_217_2]